MADRARPSGRDYERLKARLEHLVYWATDAENAQEQAGMVHMAAGIGLAIRETQEEINAD